MTNTDNNDGTSQVTEPLSAEDLPADQYGFGTVRDLEWGDIEMPDDFEPEIHIVEDDSDVTLCGQDVGCRSVAPLEPEQFENHDYDARGWVRVRGDSCDECTSTYLEATE